MVLNSPSVPMDHISSRIARLGAADYLPPHYGKLVNFIVNPSQCTVFGPNQSYFSTTQSGLSWQNLPPDLEVYIMNRIRLGRPHNIALGMHGSWNADDIKQRKGIARVALSPYIAGQFFLAFGDGSTLFNVSDDMRDTVKSVCSSMRPVAPANSGSAGDLLVATANFQLAVQSNMAMNSLFRHNF
ncbi:hypothetical protein C8F01DRAFT_1232951 [Mycena amicta]|nr:hypothetical protein C8F01DRAFT_1232951 [Mycena amicta]